MKNWIDLLSAGLTPIIAIWALFYTNRQLKLEKQKFQLELYDRRFKVFEEVKRFLSAILRDGKTDHAQLLKLMHQTNEAIFLFDDQVSDYIKSLYDKGLSFVATDRKLFGENSLPVGDSRNAVVEENSKLLEFFTDQFEVSKEIFKKYLKFDSI